MSDPKSQPQKKDVFGKPADDDAMSIYDEDPCAPSEQTGLNSATDPLSTGPTDTVFAPAGDATDQLGRKEGQQAQSMPADAQDNYFERREPAELIFCIILAAAYAGLARFVWEPLKVSQQWDHFISVEGFFITLSLLSLALGLRPYLSPSSLQISNHGIKYRGPYWPQRKTINWNQIFKLYLSPDVLIVLYHPVRNPKGMRLLFIQCNYLSDRDNILVRFSKYAPVPPIYLKNPDWYLKTIFLVGYLSLVCWILYMLQG